MASEALDHELAPDDVEVVLRGPVPEHMSGPARERVAHASRLSGRPVLHARIVLQQETNPAVGLPSRAEVSMTVGDTPIRARCDATTLTDALNGAGDRVERLIVDLVNRRNDRSRWLSVEADGQWRHGDVPTTRPPYFPRLVGEREIVRRKTFAIQPTTVDEAIYDMEALEHDFYLFTHSQTGRPAVVHRRSDGRYGTSGLPDDLALPAGVGAMPPPPVLDEDGARQRLDVGGEPFVFYLDASSGHGHVLYRRYDGHYGLISQA